MTAASTPFERLHELLATRATESLPTGDSAELAQLLATHADVDPDAYDRTAAALDLIATATVYEPPPSSLRNRLDADAVAWLSTRQGLEIAGRRDRPVARPTSASALHWTARVPWLIAAACVALAVVAWWPSPPGTIDTVTYESLLRAPETTRVEWSSAIESLDVQGDVVWNNTRQVGYMRLEGLAVNDPTKTQYQLWIYDEGRADYGSPIAVDGGVFDVTGTGEVIVPIDPKLAVFDPKLFAITTEPPGGVVEHNPELDPERFRIVVTAPVS